MEIELHPEAEEELFHSAVYYEEETEGTGVSFLKEVANAFRRIEAFPLAVPLRDHGLRIRRLNRFKHSIIYDVQPDKIFVVAIAHHSREHGYWVDRLFD